MRKSMSCTYIFRGRSVSVCMLIVHFHNAAADFKLMCCSIEYNMSYVYHSMSTYFNRDNVALPGLASYFREQSDEERGHAQLLMDFQV